MDVWRRQRSGDEEAAVIFSAVERSVQPPLCKGHALTQRAPPVVTTLISQSSFMQTWVPHLQLDFISIIGCHSFRVMNSDIVRTAGSQMATIQSRIGLLWLFLEAALDPGTSARGPRFKDRCSLNWGAEPATDRGGKGTWH